VPFNVAESSTPVKELSSSIEPPADSSLSQPAIPSKEAEAKKEPEIVKKSQDVVSTMTDAESFPALPKIKPVVSQVKEKRANSASRSKESKEAAREARNAAREAVRRPLTEPAQQLRKEDPVSPVESDLAVPSPEDVQTQASPFTSPAPKSQRQHPGKLDISAATETLKADATLAFAPQSATGATNKPESPLARLLEFSVPPSVASISRPATPAAIETPIKRSTQPRTIRLVATPKTEVLPVVSPALISTPSGLPARPSTIGRLPSRQPSIASMTVPGTPASEKISDNASITTESISRSGSPAPSRVGSAPVRIKTKSQQKKERQERGRMMDELQPTQEMSPGIEDTKQEPIMGRKKKTKKPTIAGATKTSTPSSTRSASPAPASVKPQESQPVVESPAKTPPPPPSKPAAKPAAGKPVEIPEPKVESKPPVAQVPEKKSANLPTSVIAELHASGDLMASALDFFKAAPGLNFRAEITAADIAGASPQPPLSPEEISQLDTGRPVRRGGSGGRIASRVLITPSRRYLRGLTRESEERYLDLEKLILSSKPPLKYTARQHSLSRSADDMLKEMAAALSRPLPTVPSAAAGPSNVFPSSEMSSNAVNAGKIAAYADDALAYLNQFILPPLPPRSKSGEPAASHTIGSAIPRTYTTGDPTYSVSGVDVPPAPATQNLLNAPNPATVNAYTNIAANAASAAAVAAHAAGLNINAANATATLNKADALLQSLGVDLLTGPAMKAALANVSANVTPAQGAAFASLAKSVGMLENVAAAGLAHGQQGQHGWNQVMNAMAGMGVNLNAMAGMMGLGTDEAESAMVASRRECEVLEKKMAGLVKRNKKVLGTIH